MAIAVQHRELPCLTPRPASPFSLVTQGSRLSERAPHSLPPHSVRLCPACFSCNASTRWRSEQNSTRMFGYHSRPFVPHAMRSILHLLPSSPLSCSRFNLRRKRHCCTTISSATPNTAPTAAAPPCVHPLLTVDTRRQGGAGNQEREAGSYPSRIAATSPTAVCPDAPPTRTIPARTGLHRSLAFPTAAYGMAVALSSVVRHRSAKFSRFRLSSRGPCAWMISLPLRHHDCVGYGT